MRLVAYVAISNFVEETPRSDRRDAYLRRKDMRNSCVNGEILAAVEQGARFDRPKPRTNNPERTKLDISNAAMDEFA